jgi:hypothetical protein
MIQIIISNDIKHFKPISESFYLYSFILKLSVIENEEKKERLILRYLIRVIL